jgi:hypothetical protein
MEALGAASYPEPDKTLRMARVLEITAPLGETFPCVLPGCNGHSARLQRSGQGYWQYRCSRRQRSFGLAEVLAFQAYGEVRPISDVEAARWHDRLEYEAGLRKPLSAPFALSPDRSEPLRKVARALWLLVTLRDERWDGQPFFFTRRFVMASAGVTSDQARRCVRQLEELGVLKRVGRRRMAGGYEAIVWQLGDGPRAETLLELLGTEDAVIEEFCRAFDAREESE